MNQPVGPYDIYEIYDYYYQPFWQTTFFKIVFVIVVLLLIAVTFFLFLRWRCLKQQSPWEWALSQIDKLVIEKYKNKTDFKKFYFALTDIVKKYLHIRFGWATTDKTDDELIEFLRQQGFKGDLLTTLKTMFEGALWIKFANEDVIRTQAELDLKFVKQLIEKTKPE